MGKETDIFQAAQDGNLSKLESIFSQKTSKVFSGLFKGPNINWRDDSGCTALHLAALNGHKDIVIFLLHTDASANIPDNAGSFPLHLAAFNGHHEVAKILLTRGPSKAQVNEPNMAGDTALHVAAQYGHRHVVHVLLEAHVDATLRNSKEESALDLAAQYGRLSTVQCFLFFDENILHDAIHKHSPLHLAARNGHKDVVNLLLSSGMPVNATCDMGTSLHCAALFGKVDVAKMLLHKGIDIEIEDSNGQKVLDLLCNHPSQRSQEITALIYERTARLEKPERNRLPAASYSGMQFQVVENPKRHNTVAGTVRDVGRYDIVPPPRPKTTEDYRPYSLIGGPEKTNRLSDSNDNFDLASVTPLDNSGHYNSFFNNKKQEQATGTYCLVGDVETTQASENSPVKEFRRLSTFAKNKTPKKTEEDNYVQLKGDFSSKPLTSTSKYTFLNQNNIQEQEASNQANNQIYQTPPFKTSNTIPAPEGNQNTVQNESIYQTPPKNNIITQDSIYQSPPPFSDRNTQETQESSLPHQSLQQPNYDDIKITNKPVEKYRSQTLPLENVQDVYDNHVLSSKPQRHSTDDVYGNVNITNKPVNTTPSNATPTASLSYDNVNITNKPESTDTPPLEESYYAAPPSSVTPQVFPGMVKTKSVKQKRTGGAAIKRDISLESIDEKCINIQDNKKVENDNNITDPQIEPVNQVSIEVDTDTKTIEKIVKPPRTKVKQSRTSRHQGVPIIDKSVSDGYRMSTVPKGPLDETYEWNKIDNFLSDLTEFANTGDAAKANVEVTTPLQPPVSPPAKETITDVPSWLDSLGLSQYEPMFLVNGFDDIAFLGGTLEDQDLVELGIFDTEHRRKIVDSSLDLPKTAVIGDKSFPLPQTVGEWLTKIKLIEYEKRFIHNGYGNMDRVRVIWELELVTVIEITVLGHRKRMISTLGRRPPEIISRVSWAKRFADADAGKKKPERVVDNSMDIAQRLMDTADSLKTSDKILKEANQKTQKVEISLEGGTTANSLTTEVTTKKDWKHHRDVLLLNFVAYTVQYLGSHPVQQVKGVESTLEACNKMRAISRNVHKMPYIMLSISVRGIDYVDSSSKMIISQYSMNNISFCTEDPNDFQVFAYITRDQQTKKNYCHVFKAESRLLADEIILTIGQCFELAYEQHLAMVQLQIQQKTSVDNRKIALDNAVTLVEQPDAVLGPPPQPRPYSQRKKESSC